MSLVERAHRRGKSDRVAARSFSVEVGAKFRDRVNDVHARPVCPTGGQMVRVI